MDKVEFMYPLVLTDPEYRKRWSTVSYLKINVSRPSSDTTICVNATLDLAPFFLGCIGQFGRDVLEALKIRRTFRERRKHDGPLWYQMRATISLKHFRMTGPVVLRPDINGALVFGDFLEKVPPNLSLDDVAIQNVPIVGGIGGNVHKRVFLSHSHKDKPFARALARALHQRGISVWIDEAEINIGESLIGKLRRAIDEVDFVVALISSSSIKSEWVKKELDVAMNQEIKSKRIKVLPILIDNCDLPGFLEGKLFGDFRNRHTRAKSIGQLVKSITSL
jgi:hypothetical protein